MIEFIGCIGLIIIIVSFIIMCIDELRTNYKLRKDLEEDDTNSFGDDD